MSRRGGTRLRAARKPVVVLAGEDRNDRLSMRILLEELCPQMRGRIVEVNDAARLRDAKSPNILAARVDLLAKKVRARAVRESADLACVFVHEDLDRPDGREYGEARDRVQAALDNVFGAAHYVLSVWEMEAWLLLFPDALESLVSTWQVPKQYRNRDTGTLSDPKQILMRKVSGTSRRYSVSDAPTVFEKAVALGCLHTPTGTNRSWDGFQTDAAECCEHHLGKR